MTATVIYPPIWHTRPAADYDGITRASPGEVTDCYSAVTSDPLDACASLHVEILDKVERLRHLAETGRVGNLIIIAQDPTSGLMLTEVSIDISNREELFSLIGALETVKVGLSDEATYSPTMQLDGSIADPWS